MVYWRGGGRKQGWGVGVGRGELSAEAVSSSTGILGRLLGLNPPEYLEYTAQSRLSQGGDAGWVCLQSPCVPG